MNEKRHWGLIVNPIAGIGGPVGLKGSDGIDILNEALRRGGRANSAHRARMAIQYFYEQQPGVQVIWHTADGPMGGDVVRALAKPLTIHRRTSTKTTAEDTRALAEQLLCQPLELIVVVGGDGTMRDVLGVVRSVGLEGGVYPPIVGIPAGTKIHSGAYCVSPRAAGLLLAKVADGKVVEIQSGDVMDIDEDAFRRGVVRARKYGEVRVLTDGILVQNVKSAAANDEEEQLLALAEGVVERWDDESLVFVGSGKTLAEVMSIKGLPNTLLGVDVVLNNEVILADATESELLEVLRLYPNQPKRLFVTAIGGQGHIFGRGNQQLSPAVLSQFAKSEIEVIATKAKMAQFAGRPLLVDTGDASCDQWLTGPIAVWVDYNECWYYPVASLPIEA
ncbi:MAG: ATP-NAD kinase [Gammaproteobacteria bacterium]|nr:MAG: ATP-NAD kinase [Gammaproteobacteria bacterium]